MKINTGGIMLKIELSKEQKIELENFRKLASSKDSEKALMILMSSEGKYVPEISKTLKRNPRTVRDWIKRYAKLGIHGLKRHYSPGRPDLMREKIKEHISIILKKSPTFYGYQDSAWTIPLITYNINKELDIETSSKTVTRALKSMGYTYKRPSKTVPGHAPSKEDKLEAVKKIIQEIIGIIDREDSVIYALDESHFSNEPYLVQGWFKKRWPPQDPNAKEKRKPHSVWLLRYQDTEILLEKIDNIK